LQFAKIRRASRLVFTGFCDTITLLAKGSETSGAVEGAPLVS
jgi:hypothetical protein